MIDAKDSFSCTCPHCGKDFVLEQKGLILSAMDLEAKMALLDFSFYTRECPHCHRNFAALYPLHYLDGKFSNLVRLTGNEEQDKVFPKLEVPGINAYLVRTAEAMREIILALDYELDPIKLQFFKWAYYVSLRTVQEQNQKIKMQDRSHSEDEDRDQSSVLSDGDIDILPDISILDYLYLTMNPKEDSEASLAMEAAVGDERYLLPIYKDAYDKFADVYFREDIFKSASSNDENDFFKEVDWKMGSDAIEMLRVHGEKKH